jgi:tRNA threonylcarbamoyladenosine biosynthesis protein TsaE
VEPEAAAPASAPAAAAPAAAAELPRTGADSALVALMGLGLIATGSGSGCSCAMAPARPEPRGTASAQETEAAGAELAAGLSGGDVVLVSGELGAGKTTFVRGALRALGVTEPVTSPTFVIGHLYEGTGGPLAHLDLYRLAGLGDEDPGLLDPYFGRETITFVEWPEQAPEVTALAERPVARRVALAHAGGNRRSILVAP